VATRLGQLSESSAPLHMLRFVPLNATYHPRVGPMLSVALNEHETQQQGEQQDTCPKRFKTFGALR